MINQRIKQMRKRIYALRGSVGLISLMLVILIIGFIYYSVTKNPNKNGTSSIDPAQYKSTVGNAKKLIDGAVKTRE